MRSRFYMSMMVLLFCTVSFSQVYIGVQGGVLFSNVQSSLAVDEAAIFPYQDAYFTGDRGFHFALPVAYKFSSIFSLQGELSYQRFGYNKSQEARVDHPFLHTIGEEKRIRMNFFYTNLLLKLSTGDSKVRLHVMAGPSLGISSSGHVETTEIDIYNDGTGESRWSSKSFTARESVYTRRDFGWIVGAGITIGLPHYDVFVEGRQFMSSKELHTAEKIDVMNRTIHLGVLFPIR